MERILRGKLVVIWLGFENWINNIILLIKKYKNKKINYWNNLDESGWHWVKEERHKRYTVWFHLIWCSKWVQLIFGDRNENGGGLEWVWLEWDRHELSGGDGNILNLGLGVDNTFVKTY